MKILHAVFCLLLLAAAHCTGCIACNLTEKVFDEASGLVHRCLNVTGTNEWHLNVACWVHSLDNTADNVVELGLDQKYIHPNGRDVAHCRRGSYTTALVYLVCFNGTSGKSATSNFSSAIRWPGDVWAGGDGLQYTCTNASTATSSWNFDQGSRIVLFGCNSTLTDKVIEPESSELSRDGLVNKCIFNGRNPKDPRYSMEAIGCWLQNKTNPDSYDQLTFGEEYFIVSNKSRELLATCRQRYSRQALVYHKCRETGSTGETLRSVGSAWTGGDGIQRECLPANPSELVSARITIRACMGNGTLLPPGSETRTDDGSIWRCAFSRYKSEYGWFEAVGCWLKGPHWLGVTNLSTNVHVGNEFCLTDGACLAKCEKRRYREEVALVTTVCFENVGKGSKYRLPNENWTDDNGVDRMCIPMADQSSKFGVGAETILRGCSRKDGNGTEAPGTLYYSSDFLVFECRFNSYKREYNFQETVGCWMHDFNGQRVFIASGEGFRLTRNHTLATCRKKRYSSRVSFTVEACFKDNQTSLLNWSTSSIAFPKDTIRSGSIILECDPAATYSDGVSAKWIVYGCPLETGIVSPGVHKQSEDGIVWECRHNDREGSLAAYSWIKPVGCWFNDHLNQTVVISQFNVAYNHSVLGMAIALCEHRPYSNPSLQMFVCVSQANRHIFLEGDGWIDEETRFAKQCVSTSRYSRKSVATIYAGCWLQAPKGSNSASARLAGHGTVAYDEKNRVLRCDFNEDSHRYEWRTSVACWYTNDNGTFTVLPTGQEYWSHGMLICKCHETRNGAVFVQYSCEHNSTWHAAMSVWRDTNYMYKCQPASGDRQAQVQKTHCITDDGMAITESKKINGILYVCMRICGFLVFIREPTPQQYQLLFSFINNCHTTNMNIINNIG